MTTHWGRGALIVLARHLCVHLVLDARGVPRRHTDTFVALQGRRQAPFADSAGAYLRHGNRVHLWAWPRAIMDRGSLQSRSDGRARWIPESLVGPSIVDGAVFRQCVSGVEALRFEAGLLVDAKWWPDAPGADEKEWWAGSSRVIDDPQLASQRIAHAPIWGGEFRVLPDSKAGNAPRQAWRSIAQHAVLLTGIGAAALSAAAAGWAWREQQLVRGALEQTQRALDEALSTAAGNARAGRQRPAEAAASDSARWVTQVRAAQRGLQVSRAWSALASSLRPGGFLVREFLFERDEVKLTLVSGYGTEIDLGGAVSALESSGLWSRVELIDTSNPAAVRVGVRPRAALFEPGEPGE